MKFFSSLHNESGAVLMMAIMMLVLLTVIGLSALKNTDLQLYIAGNEKLNTQTFYAADAGNEVSKELVEEIVEARGWKNEIGTEKIIDNVTIVNKDLWNNSPLPDNPTADIPGPTNRDISLPFGQGNTYLRVGGRGMLAFGGAIQMAAGYEGVGKGSSGRGSWKIYNVRSHHEGVNNSEEQIRGRWRHVN